MVRRVSSTRRSAPEWGLRIALAIAALVAGYGAVSRSLAQALASSRPESAHAIVPGDSRAAASLSAKLSGPDADAARRGRADVLALQALGRDPLAVSAVATLGLDAAIRGDTAKARQWFTYSGKLSRRDLRTQLWMIERAADRGDVALALHHYDIALRTSRIASDVLFPILSSALVNLQVRAALVSTLAGKPIWSERFISYAAGEGDAPAAVADLFAAATPAGVVVPDRAKALILTRLVDSHDVDAAWRYFASIRPGADRRFSRDPRFSANVLDPLPFDWQPVSDGGISASIQRGDRGGLADFTAPAGIGGLLLRQMQVLPAGEYVLEGHSRAIEQQERARPYWTLTCINGREIGRGTIPNSATAGGKFMGRLTVPADCPSQYLSLMARPSDEVGGLYGQIDHMSLRPAS